MKTVLNVMCVATLMSMFFLMYACGGISAHKKDSKIEKVRAEILDLVQAGRDMEPLRTSSSDSGLCEEKMEAYNAEALRIVKEISSLSEHLELRMAVIEIYNCISCSSEALAACDETENILSNSK